MLTTEQQPLNRGTSTADYIETDPNLTRDERTVVLLRRARSLGGEPAEECRGLAVSLNMPMARGLALRYRNQGLALDDLHQVAYLGLVESTVRFDPERGHGFTDFAVPTIRGELRKHFRDAGWTVRPPRRLQELQAAIRRSEQELSQRLGRAPRPSELAQDLGEDLDNVIEALAIDGCFQPSSLDAPTGAAHDAPPLADSLREDDVYEAAEARLTLGPAIRALKERDRRILELRFFEGLTQQEIGDAIGVTQMQVSRLIARILRDARQAVGDRDAVSSVA
ncbi:MAG: sigma-70 family RNA polymerase sigma factor [Marmoricola sp.]